jgi:hypothetical protein
MNAALIAAARWEHYEITRYGSLIAWAKAGAALLDRPGAKCLGGEQFFQPRQAREIKPAEYRKPNLQIIWFFRPD